MNSKRHFPFLVLFFLLQCLAFKVPARGSQIAEEILTDSLRREINLAHSLADMVIRENRLINKLDSLTLVEYPVGIGTEGGDLNYAICLDKDEITPQGAFLSAYMSFKIPETTDSLAFAARKIPLTAKGGLAGEVKLELLCSKKIPVGKGIKLAILGGEGKSFVVFDCKGFKSMTVAAQIEFDSLYIAEDPNTGAAIPGKSLTATFTTVINNWNDLLVEFSLSPFQLKGLKGFGFEVKRLVLDFSDLNNPAGMIFPQDYTSTSFIEGNRNLWRGVYIKEAIVRLPPEFKKKTDSTGVITDSVLSPRASIGGYNLLIDNQGFSGKIEASNIFSLNEGDMGDDWAFSVDKFSLKLNKNCLEEAGFSGKIQVPVLDSVLLYTAIIGMDGDFTFSASITKTNTFKMWVATLDLYPNSIIEIKSENGKFLPKVILNGKLSISASLQNKSEKEKDKSKSVSLADIEFEQLQLQTVSPKISCGAFSLGSEKAQQAMANFPIQINSIGGQLTDNNAALSVSMTLNLTNAFSADGSFTVIGEKKVVNGKGVWKYKTTEVNNLTVDVSTGPIKLQGTVIFFKQHQIYGNGFQGNINAEFGSGMKAGAVALFGKIRENRYWFADASITLSTGLPIFTGIAAYGFGGGAYFHMKQDGFGDDTVKLGKSLSGIRYIPDSSVFLGVKLSVIIGTSPKKEPFNGDVGFEIAFNSSFGVKFISFSGHGYFMTPPLPESMTSIVNGCKKISSGGKGEPDADQSGTRAAISASVLISYDFDNDVLHGNMKVYVNVAGIIKGVNPGNLAGEAVMHFSRDEWYIYIGTPDQPVGITLLNMLKTESYFMAGTKVLDSPPPPEEISRILGDIDLDYMRDLNALGAGSGIAFGSRISLNTGDLTFMMFYASLSAGVGFDIMLKNYGNVTCAGSSERLGINGWYANGQVYAYIQGAIGIKVKLFSINKKVEILSLGVAAILQAKLPNPLWMYGAVGGYFSVLGGVVKGNCRFEFTIGEECKIVGGSALDNLDVIASITPEGGANDVSVFSKPQAVFNYEVEKPFELVDIDNIKKTFRVKLDNFNVLDGINQIVGSFEWNSEHKVIALKPNDILPGTKKIKVLVQVSFEELKNGIWQAVYFEGKKIIETKEAEFTSGAAPEFIPSDNVSYSYPVVNQFNYYKDEYAYGYIKLNQGQDYLFENTGEWIKQGRYTSVKTGKKFQFNINYDFTNNEITYARPNGLNNDDVYTLELLNVPAKATQAIDANVDSVITRPVTDSEGNDFTVKTQKAEGTISELKEKIIYSCNFRSSKYNSLVQKLSLSNNKRGYVWPIRTNIETMDVTLDVTEAFDKFELHGYDGSPMLRLSADLTNNNWYETLMYPIIYKDYIIAPLLTLKGDLGIPPVNAMYTKQLNDYKELTESELSTGIGSDISSAVAFTFNLPDQMEKDFIELRNKIANYYVNKYTDRMQQLLIGKIYLFTPGTYKLNVSYYLPGKNIKTSTVPLNVNFILK